MNKTISSDRRINRYMNKTGLNSIAESEEEESMKIF